MKLILTLTIIILTINVFGQKTKKIKHKIEDSWQKEEYYVLKSNTDIKHGNYKELGSKNSVITNGYYKNNKKDSIWTEYFYRTDKIKTQGNYLKDLKTGLWVYYGKLGSENIIKKGEYKENKKVGIWEYYNKNNELYQKYDYSKNELIFFKPEKEIQTYEIKTSEGLKEVTLDRHPMYLGGKNEINIFISKNIQYPIKAIDNNISGTVIISFYIDVNGKAIDYKIEKEVKGGCSEEALRVVKGIPNKWIPGKLNGQKVITKYSLPVRFMIR